MVAFVLSQFNPDGGVRGRSPDSDLYYTVFGIEALDALSADLPRSSTKAYLEQFGDGDRLDLVHLACLIRAHAALSRGTGRDATAVTDPMVSRIESFRADDGGYAATAGAARGTVYHAFLALGAYQDACRPMPAPEEMLQACARLATPDGGYANDPGLLLGTTPTTAAMATLLRHLDRSTPASLGEWLRAQAADGGGFLAMPDAPLPDLLSTATALHALAGLQVDLGDLREDCLDFVDTLWNGNGFCGHWADDVVDVEYTYYALLALGHLGL
ncbi:MAG: prenyltransferase/squalene oxidase repeat-containing protein [Acidobacteriota bacterium]